MNEGHNKLDELRSQVDALDEKLIQILAQRMDNARSIGQYKKVHGLQPLDQQRWQVVLQTQLSRAESLHLTEEFITKLYELIHEYSLEIEADNPRSNETS